MEWGFISGEFSRDIEIDKVVPGLQERRIKGRLFIYYNPNVLLTYFTISYTVFQK